MKRRLLAVMPPSTNYLHIYDVEIAHSFEEAKKMIISAEMYEIPYAELDLPVVDEKRFWQFVEWMEETHRKYSFSIFGAKNDEHFWTIAQKVRGKGFHFNS
jgi:hypothetical protein